MNKRQTPQLPLQRFRRCLPSAFRVVKIAIKTHQREVVFLSGNRLVGIVEVKVELLLEFGQPFPDALCAESQHLLLILNLATLQAFPYSLPRT